MAHLPSTFRALHHGWTLTAPVLPDDVPATVAAALADGVPAIVPGEAHLDLRCAGLIDDPFDGANEAAQQWIGDTTWRYSTTFTWSDDASTRHDLVARRARHRGHRRAQRRRDRADTRTCTAPTASTCAGHCAAGENTLTVTFAGPVPEAAARAAA